VRTFTGSNPRLLRKEWETNTHLLRRQMALTMEDQVRGFKEQSRAEMEALVGARQERDSGDEHDDDDEGEDYRMRAEYGDVDRGDFDYGEEMGMVRTSHGVHDECGMRRNACTLSLRVYAYGFCATLMAPSNAAS
jgi:hypothetical protein